MTDEELQQIKDRLANLEKRLGGLGSTSTAVIDIHDLLKYVELLKKREKLLLHVARASVYMYAAGAGSLRGALQDLNKEWPDWQNQLPPSTYQSLKKKGEK